LFRIKKEYVSLCNRLYDIQMKKSNCKTR